MTAPRILVLNAGSSTLKASLIELPDSTLARAEIDWRIDDATGPELAGAVSDVLRAVGVATTADDANTADTGVRVDAVGHRVVHGGSSFTTATRIDDSVVDGNASVADLAPLHNTVALETIEVARDLVRGVPHVASFDTAFHATLAPAAYRYPVPESWYRDWGIRRFGFHGLSVAWSVRRAAETLERDAGDLSIVVAHLGGGSSVTAVADGRSVDTSMGLTPLDGLMMGTRSGSIDPGIPLHLLDHGLATPAGIRDDLEHASGLLGVSGISGDMRTVQATADAGDEAARLAVAMFVRSASAGIAAAATALPRLDALVFTGGIGEHAADVRRAIVARLGVLELAPLPDADQVTDTPLISAPGDRIPILRIEAREDLVIAAETHEVSTA